VDEQDGRRWIRLGLGDEVGAYGFAFSDLRSGNYLLGAGTDSGNDCVIFEGAGARGGDSVLDELEPISVDRYVSGLEFVTRFQFV
jgi:hypothetical protein